MHALAGIYLAAGMVVMMALSPFTKTLLDGGAFGAAVFAVGILVGILALGGASGMILEIQIRARKDPVLRAGLWDERAKANAHRAMAIGYNSMHGLSIAVLIAYRWWDIPGYWAVFTVFSGGFLIMTISFFAFERQGDDARD